jgi:Ca2+-binding RTX toxin-like protein
MLTLTSGITSYTENDPSGSALIDPGALFSEVGTFEGYTLTVSIGIDGADSQPLSEANRLGVSVVRGITGVNADGETLFYNGLRIGSMYRSGLGKNAALELSSLVVSFDRTPETPITSLIIQEVIRSIGWSNTSENLIPTGNTTPSGEITVRLSNGTTTIAEARKGLRLNGINDAPTIGRYYQLYDASTGLRPDQIGSAGTTTLAPSTKSWFSYQNSGDYPGGTGTATNTVANGNLTFTTDRPVAAGYSNYKVTLPEIAQVLAGGANITTSILNNNNPVLDRTKGYQFSFSGKVLSESRDSGTGVNNSDKNNDGKDDRAGFTVTLISNDLRGIELQFWTDRIWARTDGLTQVDRSLQPEDSPLDNNRRLFTQSEYVAINNSDREHQYDVSIQGSSYTVYVDGVAQLSGRIRDYTAAVNAPVTVQLPFPFSGTRTIGTPDFYEQPNLIFFGDKNPNAQASVSLSKVSLTTNETFTGSFATRAIVEDSPIVLKDIAIGDAEAQLANVLVTLTGAVGSQIQIATTTGVTIGTNGSRSVTLTGSPSKINAALLAGISYTPPLNATGSQSLEIKVNDQGQGGSPLETTKSIAFDISPVADAPSLNGNGFINVGQSATLAELFAGKFSDPDLASPAIAGFAITSNPATVAQGSWQYQTAGTTVWTPIGSLTPNQVLTLSSSTLIRFTPTVGFIGTPPVLGVKAIDSTLTVANGTIITPTTNQLALYSNGQSIVTGRTATALAPIVFRTGGLNITSTKTGAEANETLYASKSDDFIDGGEGDDWIGGGGCDFLIQLSGRFLWDRDGNDQFNGGAGNDELYGYGGNDSLVGGTGNDRLDGGRGNDILIGGTGLDTLVGDSGIDTFTINAIGEGLDTILDFEVGIDLIDLRGIFAGSAFAGTSTFARYQQFVTIAQSGTADSLVNIDSDGLGSGTAQTTLFELIGVTAASITSESFIIADTLP